MKNTGSGSQQNNTPSSGTNENVNLSDEFRADDVELCNAATKIQASFRGHMSRIKDKAVDTAADAVAAAESEIKKKIGSTVDELEAMDLTDPDLHKAATKIQASFRGHKVRQEVNESL